MLLYRNVSGSVYTLPADSFEAGKTGWEGDLVSMISVKVASEIHVEDALETLLGFERAGQIVIHRYPNRPSYIPQDDSDLVEKAAIYASWDGNERDIRKRFQKSHPHLYERLDQLIESNQLVQLGRKHGIPVHRHQHLDE